jgi:hypothetical protein
MQMLDDADAVENGAADGASDGVADGAQPGADSAMMVAYDPAAAAPLAPQLVDECRPKEAKAPFTVR